MGGGCNAFGSAVTAHAITAAKYRKLGAQAGGMNLTLNAIRRCGGDPRRSEACSQLRLRP